MAILHVRGVPDDLYEQIRTKARAERRSISGEVILLLERAVAAEDEIDPAGADYRRRAAALRQQAERWYQERQRPMGQEEYDAVLAGIAQRADAMAATYGPFSDSTAILRADRERDERRW
jgi:plasmid stability protein